MVKKACLITFGCQMNNYDSDRLAELLISCGWEITKDKLIADFIFFNTCSIREKAAQKVVNHVSQLKSLKNFKPELIIGVGGCVAQQEGEKLLESLPHLSLVAGPQHLPEIPSALAKLEVDPSPILLLGHGLKPAWSNENLDVLGYGKNTNITKAPLSAFVTIMQGCDNFCSYCVVPYLRGPEKSRLPADIIEEVKKLLDNGAKEITLLGQNVNSYGKNENFDFNFSQLLLSLSKLPNLKRLRFTTSHPKDFPQELIDLFASLEVLCPSLHLPVQAGSDKILKLMNRSYNRDQYLNLVNKIKKARPDIALTSDIIVGFPGETEDDFEKTIDLIQEVNFDSLFSFKYSDRPGTASLNMPDKVSEDEKSRRLTHLQNIQKNISLDKNNQMKNKVFEVLVEGASSRYEGQLRAKTSTAKIVNFDGSNELIGQLVNVKITEAWAASLRAELLTA